MPSASFLSASTATMDRRRPVRRAADLYAMVCSRATSAPRPSWDELPPEARRVYEQLFEEASAIQEVFSQLPTDRRVLLANRYAGLTPEGGTPVPRAELRLGTPTFSEAERSLYRRMQAFRGRLAALTRAPDRPRPLARRDAGEAVAPREHFGREEMGSMAEVEERRTPPPKATR